MSAYWHLGQPLGHRKGAESVATASVALLMPEEIPSRSREFGQGATSVLSQFTSNEGLGVSSFPGPLCPCRGLSPTAAVRIFWDSCFLSLTLILPPQNVWFPAYTCWKQFLVSLWMWLFAVEPWSNLHLYHPLNSGDFLSWKTPYLNRWALVLTVRLLGNFFFFAGVGDRCALLFSACADFNKWKEYMLAFVWSFRML